jgi:vacuolar-type H+-ATPase subunit I/STV1
MAQSFAQTEPWFHFHDVILRDVYQMILDMTQYIELQKPDSVLNYLNNNLESVFLKVTRDDLLRDLQVYVTSYAEDRDTIEKLRSLMQPAMQNGADLADIADMLTANSERSLREVLQKVQKRNQEAKQQEMQLKQQQLEQQQQQFEMQIQVQEQKRMQEMQNENMNKQLDRENKLQIEQLRGIAAEGSYSPTIDTTELLTEQTKTAMERSRLDFEKTIKQKELQQTDRKLDIEEKKAKDALDIAKLRDKGTLNPKPKSKK